ncbi:MAG: DUF1697 domain-containing protein [Oscillospiraceae bacterium]|jgi:uncharacterized protein (DUF1697 family)|nr:DUF1697 domain-containing protein [Oscillospiraceae bacterium]
MTKYIALLRGVNVGGNNKIAMPQLKAAFEKAGFQNTFTYINSGNIIFESDLDEAAVKAACEALIAENFSLNILVCIITAAELHDALAHAPDWWGSAEDSKHNAIFLISPATAAEILAQIGETKPEVEKISCYGRVIFWSAPLATFSRTRLTKIVQSKAAYNAITIRNANTAKKLARLTLDT